MGKIDRKVATRAYEIKVAKKMGRKMGSSRRDYCRSHDSGAERVQPPNETREGRKGTRLARRRSSGTATTHTSVAERSHADINDPVMCSRDASDLLPNEMHDDPTVSGDIFPNELPDDPIMSERSEYESHMSG